MRKTKTSVSSHRVNDSKRLNTVVVSQIDRLPFGRLLCSSSDVQHDVTVFDTLEHLQHLRVGHVLSALPVDK